MYMEKSSETEPVVSRIVSVFFHHFSFLVRLTKIRSYFTKHTFMITPKPVIEAVSIRKEQQQ